MAEDANQPERPRIEPEIIPPDRSRPDWPQQPWDRQTRHPFFSAAGGETHRIYIARPGPLGIALFMLILGVVIAAILFAVIGAVLIWIPVVALVVAVSALFRFLRR